MGAGGRDVFVAGVGMVPFTKPAQSPSYDEMGRDAILLALTDADVSYDAVEQQGPQGQPAQTKGGHGFGSPICEGA